jgi:hypothetical protein
MYKRRIGSIAYVLGLGAWITPWLGLMHEPLVDGSVDLPLAVLMLPSAVTALLMLGVAVLMTRARQLPSIVLLGGLGASLVFGLASVAICILEAVATADAPWLSGRAVVGTVFALPLGLVLCVPAVVIAAAHQAGPCSHEDGDVFTAFAGAWIMLGALFAVALTASDPHLPYQWRAEGVEMIVMNAGAAILALGVGRFVQRRQWLARARRGEIEGVRVRRLGATENVPDVLPLVALSHSKGISVVEVVERPPCGPYRGAEIVHPIALA